MTPFGEAMRELRRQKGVTQRALADAIGVTPAYLSALERGNRGRPTFELLQRITGYFNIIWDEADQLFRAADLSHPRVVLDTTGLPAAYTDFANRLAAQIRSLPPDVLEAMQELLRKR